MNQRSVLVTTIVLFVLLFGAAGASAGDSGPNGPAAPVGTSFTYQGQIKSSGNPVNGNCDMGFRLYGVASGGSPVASVISLTVPVTASLFTVGLDFGAGAVDGSARWLDLSVRCPAGSGAFAHLDPRQPLTAAPYALFALNNWSLTGNAGTSPSNFLGTTNSMTLTLRISNTAVVRYVPNATSPNIIAGASSNAISLTVFGAVIAGGGDLANPNTAGGNFDTISGGSRNSAIGLNATVSGGFSNTASYQNATVGGGDLNQATNYAATVAGGGVNTASNAYAAVGGGYGNNASGPGATIGGGGFDGLHYIGNSASGVVATVGGGSSNQATGDHATIGGGGSNIASGTASTVGGGGSNQATDYGAAVGGGGSNTASNVYATVGGGNSNIASGPGATIGGGGYDGTNYGGNSAAGNAAMVPGGFSNSAAGAYSFAAGLNARAIHNGAFVWADSTGAIISSTTTDQFIVRATGGVTMYTDSAATMGVQLAHGSGAWSSVSDRNLKANFSAVDGLQVLDALAGISIQTWNYKTQAAAIRHMGPMAQDFHAAFGVGENDTTISTVDAQGVALAAIQGLYHLAQSQDAQLKSQQAQIDDLQARLAALERQPAAPPPQLPPLAPDARAGVASYQLPITIYQLPLLGWLLFGALLLLNLGGLLGYFVARGRRAAGGGA